jgi:hypothetical protein
MARIIKRRPSPAMIVAIIACVLATAGTSAAFSLNILGKQAKIKTVGPGPLVYSSSQAFIPAGQTAQVAAGCPEGLHVVGGGIRVSTGGQQIEGLIDSFPRATSWGGTVSNVGGTESHTAITIAICANTLRTRGTIGGF